MNRLPQAAPRRALLAALIGLALAGPASAGGVSRPEGLCTPAETAYFSCRTASGAWIALCEAAVHGLQYRFGRPGQIALTYPTAGRPDFRYAHYFRAGVDRTEVSFRNGDADYAVFDYTEGRQRSAGVRVLTASGREKTFACRGAVLSRLGALEAALPCDADSALNLGSCPAPRVPNCSLA